MSTKRNYNNQKLHRESSFSTITGQGKSEYSIENSLKVPKPKGQKKFNSHQEIQKRANLSSSKSEGKSKNICFITGFSPEENQALLLDFLS